LRGDALCMPSTAPLPAGMQTLSLHDALPICKAAVLNWGTVTGNRISGGGWEERTRPIAEAKADAAGNVEFRFDVPDDLGGSHARSEEHTSELQSPCNLVCRLLLEKKNTSSSR